MHELAPGAIGRLWSIYESVAVTSLPASMFAVIFLGRGTLGLEAHMELHERERHHRFLRVYYIVERDLSIQV